MDLSAIPSAYRWAEEDARKNPLEPIDIWAPDLTPEERTAALQQVAESLKNFVLSGGEPWDPDYETPSDDEAPVSPHDWRP